MSVSIFVSDIPKLQNRVKEIKKTVITRILQDLTCKKNINLDNLIMNYDY